LKVQQSIHGWQGQNAQSHMTYDADNGALANVAPSGTLHALNTCLMLINLEREMRDNVDLSASLN
jgi:hypothetical protein